MYDFVDRPLASLDRGGRFLVVSMRLWVGAIGLGQCPSPAVAPAFAQLQMIGALAHFHRAMALFNRDALETFQFCALHCDHVSEHEAIVLSLVRALGLGHAANARDTLALLVGEDAIGDLIASLSHLGCAMRTARALPQAPGIASDHSSSGATSTE